MATNDATHTDAGALLAAGINNRPTKASVDAALATKAALAGSQTFTGINTFSSAPVVPDGSFPPEKVTGLTTALAAKASVSSVPVTAPVCTGTGQSIATRFPAVTLGEVQALNAAATLSDTADWYLLQKFIADNSTTTSRHLKIPQGSYQMSRELNLSTLKVGVFLECEGVTLNATQVMDQMVNLHATAPALVEAWHLNIHGLHLTGNFIAKSGFNVDGAQEWVLSSVRVYRCETGLRMKDTWYGEVSGLSVFQDCLVGLDFALGAYSEINTIGIYNLKINFATLAANFPNVVAPESMGIRLSSDIKAVNFHRLNVEATDYVLKAVAGVCPGGYQGSIYTFEACYFESIKIRCFDYNNDSVAGAGNIMRNNFIVIRGCRFNAGSAQPSFFSYGRTELVGNQPLKAEFRKSSNGLPVQGIVDGNVTVTNTYENATGESLDTIIRRTDIPNVRNWQRFAAWGVKGIEGYDPAMVSTVNHASWQLGAPYPGLRGTWANPSKYFPVTNIQPRPVVFVKGTLDEANGPVVYGTDGWYMLLVGVAGAVSAKKITNVYRLDEHPGCRTAKELHYLAATETIGKKYQCIDLNGTWLTLSAGRRWTESGIIRVGTMEELNAVRTSMATNALVYDVNTSQCSWKDAADVWKRYTWWGESLNELTSGTLASRPATPSEGLIYFNTDDSTYSKYTASAWAAFTPNNTA